MKHEDDKMQAIKRATVIYDGACPICSKTVAWMEEHEQPGSFEMLPCQSESLGNRFPSVDRAACMRAMHVVLPDGSVLAGEQALPEVFKRLKRLHYASALFKLPGAKILSRAFYRWFAERRYHIAAVLHMGMKERKRR